MGATPTPEGINTNIYYRWSKGFLEAGKKRLAGDIVREATSDEVRNLRTEALYVVKQHECSTSVFLGAMYVSLQCQQQFGLKWR
ncbi:hypothetical protein ATY38_10895 [Nitrosomonas ureae]|nr:hypothetical protein ATY38_10895 [Nitrosomonas ureae]